MKKELPIVCTLTPDTMRVRREGLLSDLRRRAEHIDELADGLRIRFAPASGIVERLATAVESERHCCRFLRFTIVVEPDGGPIFLELTGPPGTREFLAALLEP